MGDGEEIAELPVATSLFQLAIASHVDLGLSSGKSILRRHIADRAVQSHRLSGRQRLPS